YQRCERDTRNKVTAHKANASIRANPATIGKPPEEKHENRADRAAYGERAATALWRHRTSRLLFLLCHKFRYLFRAAQHGQRDSIVARAATNLRRIVAIEFGTWRSGRNGGSSGLVTFA